MFKIYIYYFLSALVLSYILTPIIRNFALRYGYVAKTRNDRWHEKPTALLGGVAIFLSFMLILTSASLFLGQRISGYTGLIAGGSTIFLTGLIDDLRGLPPQIKLLCQIIASAIAVVFGIQSEIIPYSYINIPLTILWLVAITNAFNLIDNMDGLSAGIAVISSGMMFIYSYMNSNTILLPLTAIVMGSSLGFLRFNFKPARIFMGDSGSMFLGFSMGAIALVGTWKEASNLVVTMIVPVMILAVPVFDVALVTVIRKLKGIPVSRGGRDHSSHRLVSLGLSEKRAVLYLYGICFLFGALVNIGAFFNIYTVVVLSILSLITMFIFGIFLGTIDVYDKKNLYTDQRRDNSAGVLINAFIVNKKQIVEVVIDFILICVAYMSAYLLRFEGNISPEYVRLITFSLPIIIIVKFSMFYLFGLYRGTWKYTGLYDMLSIIKAVTLSSVISVTVIVFIQRFSGFSRAVFVIDWMLTLILIGGARIAVRLFREHFVGVARRTGKKVLIYGAGDGGDLLLREIKNNRQLNYNPVGIVDDDPLKSGLLIHGVPVVGTRDNLERIVEKEGVEEVIIAMPSISDNELEEIYDICRKMRVKFQRMASILSGSSRNY